MRREQTPDDKSGLYCLDSYRQWPEVQSCGIQAIPEVQSRGIGVNRWRSPHHVPSLLLVSSSSPLPASKGTTTSCEFTAAVASSLVLDLSHTNESRRTHQSHNLHQTTEWHLGPLRIAHVELIVNGEAHLSHGVRPNRSTELAADGKVRCR